MTLQEVKDAVKQGKTVCWSNEGYRVIRTFYNDWEYYIKHTSGDVIGLTHRDGVTLNGKESEFFIAGE